MTEAEIKSTRMDDNIVDSARPALATALNDIISGVKRWPLWGRLGWMDILQRYRRSAIGPFWITISMGVMVSALGLLYAVLFKLDVSEYLPFLAIGFILWGLISGLVNEGCLVFIEAEGVIKQLPVPISIHVYRVIWRNILLFLHNIIVFFIVVVIFSVPIGWSAFQAVGGLILLLANGLWVTAVLGLLCARFRDATPIMASILQLSFFVTPIIWRPEMLPDRAVFLVANPFFHAIEIVRAPLLGGSAEPLSWIICLAMVGFGWLVALPLIGFYRSRLVYWL